MATLSEIIANRDKLVQSGLSLQDAKQQAYSQARSGAQTVPVSPAPVAGVAPATTAQVAPTTPTPATTTPVTPMVQAPVDATTGLSKPLAPNPATPTPVTTAEVTPITPKVDATPGINPTTYAQANAESEKIKAQNQAVMDQNKQKADLATQDRQAIAKETQIANTPTDSGTIFATLRAGGTVASQNTPEYRQAQSRYNTFKKFSTYDVASLSTSIQSGDLLMGTQAYTDLVSDPNMLAKIQKAKVFTNGEVDLIKTGEKMGAYVMSNNPTVAQALADGSMSQEEYNALTNNAEVETQAKVVSEKKDEYDKYKRQLENISDEVDLEFDGKEVTDSFKSAIKANRDKAIRRLFNSASDEYQNASGLYTELKNSSTQLLALNMEQYKTEQAQQAQLASEQRQVQAQKDMFQYKSDFEKKQAQEALNDPATAIASVMDEYKKLGIPFTSTVQSRLDEFKNSGLSLPDYLTKMGQNIQQSPAYQNYERLQKGQLSDAQKFQMQTAVENQRDTRNFAQQMQLAKYNNDSAREKFLFEIENDPEKKAKAIAIENSLASNKSLFDVLGKNVGTYEGNRGYDLAGAMGDPLPAGGNWTVKSIDTAGEQVGSIFIGGKGKKPYGNTVVMVDENGNEIRYSHLQNIGVKKGDVLGFGDIVGTRGNTGNVKGANGETLTAEQLAQGRGAHLDVEIKSGGKLLSNADQVNFLKGLKAGGTGTNASALPIYRAYMEDNKLPSKDALAGLGMTSEQFANNADAGYDAFLKTKAKEISDTYPTLDIEYTGNYAGNSATQKEKLNESVTKIGDIDSRISQLKSLFAKNGTEVWPTADKSVMESLRKQIILKAKEVENLGVLNGPDLGILEDLLPSTTGFMSGMFSLDANTMAKIENIQNNYRNDAKTKAINYGARLNFGDAKQQQSNTTPAYTPEAQSIENEWLNR